MLENKSVKSIQMIKHLYNNIIFSFLKKDYNFLIIIKICKYFVNTNFNNSIHFLIYNL
jgi:hypothetical protein